MNNPIPRLLDCVPTLISNTHLDIHLAGWPAASAVASICGTIVAVVAIVVTDRRNEEDRRSRDRGASTFDPRLPNQPLQADGKEVLTCR